MKTIGLKILPAYFKAVADGRKAFELRKDDRGYEAGDRLVLKEWDDGYTGRFLFATVSFVLRGAPEYGLEEGWCILSLKDVSQVY